MGISAIKMKIMPSSPEINLKELQSNIKSLIENQGGKNREYVEEPIAFGLKAIIAFFEWPEEKELEQLEEELKKIENINSIQVIEMRKVA